MNVVCTTHGKCEKYYKLWSSSWNSLQFHVISYLLHPNTLRSTVAPYHPAICGTKFHTRTKQRLPPVLSNPCTMVMRIACLHQWGRCLVISILFVCSADSARYKYTEGSSFPSNLTSICTIWHAGNSDWRSYHGLGKTNEHDSTAYVWWLTKETCPFSAAVTRC
jgi:hypothetical protein